VEHALRQAVKIVGDLLCIHAGYFLAFLLRFQGRLPEANWKAYLHILPALTLVAVILLYAYEFYSEHKRRWSEFLSSLICVVSLLMLSGISLSYLMQTYAFPRTIFFMAAVLQFLLLYSWRRFLWIWSLKREGALQLFIVGPALQVQKRIKDLTDYDGSVINIVGVLETDNLSFSQIPDGGIFPEIAASFDKTPSFAVLICDGIEKEKRSRIILQAVERGLPVFLIPEVEEIFLAQATPAQLNGIPVLHLHGAGNGPGGWKRFLDITLAVSLMILFAPLILLAALAIKIESPGPAFYLQERVGKDGRIFRLIKLRTMIPEAEKFTGPVLSHGKDPRITRVGRFLRLTRIDELPQLWNVLKGDMSFVGPRPERPFFVSQFQAKIPGYNLRHSLPVGITGLAQVEGKYSTPPEDKLRFDLIYGQRASFLEDLRLLLRTLSTVMLKDKAS